MINLSNLLAKETAEMINTSYLPKQQKLKLLLILSPAAVEKAGLCFAGADLVIATSINEARHILNITNKSFFDAVICDAAISRNAITELSSFLDLKKLAIHTPLLLMLLNDQALGSLRLKRIEGVDDVISCDTTVTDLAQKIKIIKKYKLLHEKLPYNVELPKPAILDRQYILKRSIDIILSSLFLLILLPLFLFVAIAIKLESKGPVFYRSQRAGAWYKVFTFYKFRTMIANAESMIPNLQYMNEYKDFQKTFFFKMKDDPRVTRVGRILRKTSLDELPQLINVLIGDMSLVGNRPLPLYEAQTITVDKSAKRFFAPAGITGLWQVKGRSNYNLTAQERINMDIDYANKNSFLLDLKILLRTPKELIHKHDV